MDFSGNLSKTLMNLTSLLRGERWLSFLSFKTNYCDIVTMLGKSICHVT